MDRGLGRNKPNKPSRSMHGCHQDRIFEAERNSPAVFALASTHVDALEQQNQNVLGWSVHQKQQQLFAESIKL